jgi:hypothetical protein
MTISSKPTVIHQDGGMAVTFDPSMGGVYIEAVDYHAEKLQLTREIMDKIKPYLLVKEKI